MNQRQNATGDDQAAGESDLSQVDEHFPMPSAPLPAIQRWRTPEEVRLIVRNIMAAIQASDQGQEVYDKWATQHFSPEHHDPSAQGSAEGVLGMDRQDHAANPELERKLLEIFTSTHEIEHLGDGWTAEEIAPGVLGSYGP